MSYLVYSTYLNKDWVVKAKSEFEAVWKVIQDYPEADAWHIFGIELFIDSDIEPLFDPSLMDET